MKVVRLKQVAEVRYGLGQPPPASPEGIPILRATNIQRGRITSEGLIFAALKDLPLGRAPLLKAGEVLVVRSGAYTGDSALVTPDWEGSAPGYDLRLTPRLIDPRFLAYQMLGSRVLDQIALARIRAAQPHLNAEDLGDVEIMTSSAEDECRVADYLDAETGGIDDIVERLTQANLLLDEWIEAQIETTIWSPGDPAMPLMHLTPFDRQIQYGIVLPGPDVPDGVSIVKGGDIVTGRLGVEGLARTTYEIEAGYARSRLRRNDIVFAIRGAVGACAMVPEEVEGANITQDVARVAPLPGVDPAWLLYALKSRSLQQRVESRIVGATIRGINIRDLKRVRVPVPTSAVQALRADGLRQAQAHRDEISTRRSRQIGLLLERRKALITAAVTGQLEIPGVAA